MPDQVAAALAFLQRDVRKNIVPLKMLHAYSPAITCNYLERGAEAGVLVMLPPTVFSYDAEAYPDADWIVLLSTTGLAMAPARPRPSEGGAGRPYTRKRDTRGNIP